MVKKTKKQVNLKKEIKEKKVVLKKEIRITILGGEMTIEAIGIKDHSEVFSLLAKSTDNMKKLLMNEVIVEISELRNKSKVAKNAKKKWRNK